MRIILDTQRLTLREFTHEDAAFIRELVNTPGWLTYIGERNVRNEEQAKGYLDNGPIKSYHENGFGLWCVTLKKEGSPIGMCGLLRRNYLDHPDIGFAFLPEYQGKGYAYEAAEGTVHYAKDTLRLPNLCAIVMPENHHSIRLLEKIGLRHEKPILIPPNNEQLLLYSRALAL